MPDSREQYRTFLGTALSLFTMLVMCAYLSYRIMVVVIKDEYTVMEYTEENHFEIFPGFSVGDGFKVAAGVTTYDAEAG